MGGKFGLTLVQVALLKIGCARGKIFLFGIFLRLKLWLQNPENYWPETRPPCEYVRFFHCGNLPYLQNYRSFLYSLPRHRLLSSRFLVLLKVYQLFISEFGQQKF